MEPATVPPSQRLVALDNLRGLMMWLGIVLHVGAIHMAGPSPLPWRDDQTSPWADALVAFIHTFRMPVFFILAGFFVALLVHRRGARAMLVNRLRRLGLPFVLFWLPVFVACVVCALLFVHRVARGTWGLDLALMPVGPSVPTGPNTMHLWFLWMLLWFSVLTAGVLRLAPRMPAALPRAVHGLLQRLGLAWWGFAVLALPLALVGAFYPNGVVMPSGAFLPPPAEWLHNGLFYLFGYCAHARQQVLFAGFTRRWPIYAALGLAFFVATAVLVRLLDDPPRAGFGWPLAIALVYNCASWLWSFALIGAFLRFLQRPYAPLTYLADSSYWVYLVHMPLTIGFGALLYGMPWPAFAKLSANVLATTAVCLASYHLLVRFTAVGALLNGRRHPRSKAARDLLPAI
ncbi:MAG: acyltransferase [Comamonadaceae bacterium]|nr:MAG: acyltransferase [Comamonadaceae bacterium]